MSVPPPLSRSFIIISLIIFISSISFVVLSSATEVYHDSFALGFSTRPMIRFVQPVQDTLVLSGKLTVQVVVSPPDLQMKEMNLFFCIELIYRHGHERRCYLDETLPWTASIDGLQAGKMQILATLEHNTSSIDPNEDSEQINSITIAKTQVGFEVAETSLSPTMQITYPRPKEHLSTKDVDVAMRIGNFLPNKETTKKNVDGTGRDNEAGYFCVTFVQDIGDPKKERKHNKCIVPDTQEVVMSTSFHNGVHAVSARLYSKNGKPMKNQASATSTIFRVSSLSPEEQNSIGPIHWPNTNGDYSVIDEKIRIDLGENTPPPSIIHIAIMSVRSYNRYHESIVMIKSLLFHRKTTKIIHLHLIVDQPGQKFFERELLSMQPGCVRVTFHSFKEVCLMPNVQFLRKFNFSLSAHYSGHAGYCRLHMPKWFAKHYPKISTLIAIETDQIFMDDISGLFSEFEKFNNDAIVGMAEMYKPWRDGRVTADKEVPKLYDSKKIMDDMTNGNANNNDVSNNNKRRSTRGSTTEYHGNGYIGGIIMFNLKKIKKLARMVFDSSSPPSPSSSSSSSTNSINNNNKQDSDKNEQYFNNTFEQMYYESLTDFLMIERETDPLWNPQLNDQDIFNAMFTMRPELVHTIDCKWQLQFHSFQEHRRLCDGQSFFNTYDYSCPESIKSNMFLCKKSPGLVHFMAQSYMTKSSGPSYVSFSLPLNLLIYLLIYLLICLLFLLIFLLVYRIS
jgi:hypothetical protein